jgi:hypothetical protein
MAFAGSLTARTRNWQPRCEGYNRSRMARQTAFVSYSHLADADAALTIARELSRLGTKWFESKRPILIDRHHIPPSVQSRAATEQALQNLMERADYLILLASPEAAKSEWVAFEIENWIAKRGVQSIILALTDGMIAWDSESSAFDVARSSAVPPALRAAFSTEPLYVDLRRYAKGPQPEDRQLQQIAATIDGRARDFGDAEISRHRRARLLLAGVFGAGAILGGIVVWLAA